MKLKPEKPRLKDQILWVMQTDPGRDWESSEIAEMLGSPLRSIQSTMSRMKRSPSGKIQKTEMGYRLGKSNLGRVGGVRYSEADLDAWVKLRKVANHK